MASEARTHGLVGGAPSGAGASGGDPLRCRPSFCAFSLNARVPSLLPVLLLDVKQFLKQTSQ